jgi:cysteine desulfurase family protein (TIGR01976 family)
MHAEAPVASAETIRAAFPALTRRQGAHEVAYFDGPGGTQVPQQVADAVTDYLLRHNANTHWAYPTSAETDAMLWSAREALGDFLGAAPTSVSFGVNMTTLLFHIARAIGRTLQPGDEIVVTELDHHANVAPWQALAVERGVVLRWIPLDVATFTHAAHAWDAAITSRTKVVAVGAASNMLGTITDLAPIIARAQTVGAHTVVDAVHAAPHALMHFDTLGADVLLASAYKFYGPHVGVAVTRPSFLATLDVPKLEPAPDQGPERLETGTQNHEGIVGAGAAVDFLASLAAGAGTGAGARRDRLRTVMQALHVRSEALFATLWRGLAAIDGVVVYGQPPSAARTPTVSFRLDGKDSGHVARALVHEGLYCSHGDFYAATIARRLALGADGAVRVGCACYTNAAEIDRVVDAVRRIASNRA